MGENQKPNVMFYSIDGSTGEMKPLGEGQPIEIPKLTSGGLEKEKYIDLAEVGEGATFECTIVPKTITRKRFIKLLMGMGYQRNEASKMHQEHMKIYKSRTKLTMMCFESFYKQDLEIEFEIKINGRNEKYEKRNDISS